MSVESGTIAATETTGTGDVSVRIQVTELRGIFDKQLVSRTIDVTMSRERLEAERARVENGTVRYLGDYEHGEHYD